MTEAEAMFAMTMRDFVGAGMDFRSFVGRGMRELFGEVAARVLSSYMGESGMSQPDVFATKSTKAFGMGAVVFFRELETRAEHYINGIALQEDPVRLSYSSADADGPHR